MHSPYSKNAPRLLRINIGRRRSHPQVIDTSLRKASWIATLQDFVEHRHSTVLVVDISILARHGSLTCRIGFANCRNKRSIPLSQLSAGRPHPCVVHHALRLSATLSTIP